MSALLAEPTVSIGRAMAATETTVGEQLNAHPLLAEVRDRGCMQTSAQIEQDPGERGADRLMETGFDTDWLRLAKGHLRQARVCVGHLRAPGRSSTQVSPHLERLFTFFKADLSGDSCWEWTGGCSSAGFPKLSTESATTSIRIKRLIWVLFLGPLRGGLHPGVKSKDFETVSSSCGNQRCLRPSHLFKRAALKGRANRVSYQGIGPRKSQPALSAVSVARRVRAETVIRLKREGITNSRVATTLQMSLTQVERIVSGTSFPFLCREGLRESIRVSSRLRMIESRTKYKTDEERRSAKANRERRYRRNIEQLGGVPFEKKHIWVAGSAING